MSGRGRRGRRRAAEVRSSSPPAEEEEEHDDRRDRNRDEDEAEAPTPAPEEDDRNDEDNADVDDDDEEEEEVDEDTLRIMISTDNHLGYAERDPVRGLDSFAAFEEVLSLAKRHKCDMVLLAGDLFHDNKPTRRTLHKTMEIVRRYCMGPRPVQFQIVSDQAENFRGPTNTVNYEDEHYSIDLPIFSIHGNHDDPTRDGGTEMLAALDLLAVSNLVNYFGRQDEVDKVEVAPVLIRKGSTKVAVYGMGSMRDERLNRMWQGKKVRFLEPVVAAGEDQQDEGEEEGGGDGGGWFNIFALHQNRDLGRGSKNCVHESMIPEYMDLVVWGHEHECRILPDESAVGTFRISQPGSSVATSLTAGEAEKKQVGILDVRGQSFRLRPVPLSQVRPFATGEISLRDELENEDGGLDPEDPNVDEAMADVLADHVTNLIEEARESAKALREEAEEAARGAMPLGTSDADESVLGHGQKYKLIKPDQVLVRLKVEHSGFGTLNNQRFGSRFVSEVANPSDILLFHRRKQVETVKAGGGSKSKRGGGILDEPLEPEELAEINVEDLVKENLETADKKLQVLDESRLGVALDEFVSKEQRSAIDEAVQNELRRSQKELIRRNNDPDGEGGDGEGGEGGAAGGGGSKITTAAAVREVCSTKAEQARARAAAKEGRRAAAAAAAAAERGDDDDDVVMNGDDGSVDGRKEAGKKRGAGRGKARSRKGDSDDDDDDSSVDGGGGGRKGPATKRARTAAGTGSKSKSAARSRRTATRHEESSDDDDLEIVETTPAPSSSAAGRRNASRSAAAASSRPSRRGAASGRARYKDVSDGDSDDGDDDFIEDPAEEEEEDDEIEVVAPPPKSKRGAAANRSRATPAGSARGRATPASSARKQSTLSAKTFTSARKPRATASAASASRRKKTAVAYNESDSDDDGGRGRASADMGEGWGTANSQASYSSRRSRR